MIAAEKPRLQSEDPEEHSEWLLRQEVIDITHGFPARDGQDFTELMLTLFLQGVSRIPIIGVDHRGQTRIYCLITTKIQEHKELVKKAQINQDEIVFTASLERLPIPERISSDKCLILTTENKVLYQEIGIRSDFFSHKPLTMEGLSALERIFAGIGVIE